jgi:uridine kinase
MAAPPHSPRIVPWHDAVRETLDHARARSAPPAPAGPIIIGITGPVGSGKSTLAARLGGAGGCVISTDSYLPDYDAIPEMDRDLPELADLARLASDLAALRSGTGAEVPVWSFKTHRREGYRRVAPAPLIVCEGIHALHATVAASHTVRVFVDAPATVRWERWERIELAGERGWGVEPARRHFDHIAEPTFRKHARAYRRAADLIVLNDRNDGLSG